MKHTNSQHRLFADFRGKRVATRDGRSYEKI